MENLKIVTNEGYPFNKTDYPELIRDSVDLLLHYSNNIRGTALYIEKIYEETTSIEDLLAGIPLTIKTQGIIKIIGFPFTKEFLNDYHSYDREIDELIDDGRFDNVPDGKDKSIEKYNLFHSLHVARTLPDSKRKRFIKDLYNEIFKSTLNRM